MARSSLLYVAALLVVVYITTCTAATLNPEPVIWDVNPKLMYTSGLTAAGAQVILTIDGYNFGTNYLRAYIQVNPSAQTTGPNCTIYYAPLLGYNYNDTRIYCKLPAGDGLPLLNLVVGAYTMRQLPRWNDDFYFWVWTDSSTTNNPNCIQTPNPITPEPTHTWGDNWFCTATAKASLLMQYSMSGAISGQQCINMNQPNESDRWFNKSFICLHPKAPYQIQWSMTGAVNGLGCVPVREGSDPYWDDGLKQICGTTNTPYNGGAALFYQYSPPILSSLTPNHGPTIGGTIITVRGYSFGASVGSIYIGSSACTIDSSTYTHTQFQCTTPSGQGQTNAVTITVNTQTQLNTLNFNYDAPVVAVASPATSITSGGNTLTITGINFGTTQGTAALGSYYCAVVTWIDTKVTCTIPAGMGASLPVVLTTYDSATSNTNVLFSYARPNITSITPNSTYTQGNVPVTIVGSSFGGTGVARIGGTLCVTITWAHTLITCTMGAGSGSNSAVTVTAASQVNDAFYFHFYAPVITAIGPAAGTSGAGVYITLSGTSFGTTSVGAVTVNGVACASTSSQYSDTRILCQLPSGSGYRIPVKVLVADQYSNSVNFTYTPVISTISFTSASTIGGTAVTIDGTSFAADPSITWVAIAGVACPLKSTTLTRIICVLPVGQGTSQVVTLQINDQVAPSSTFSYDAPVIATMTPSSGGTAGGYNITLTGINFGTTSTVTLGLASCAIVFQNHTRVICTAPAGSGQANPVVVTVSGQQSSSVGFNYNPPTITNFWPKNAAIDGGAVITLQGTDFASAGLVTIGTNVVSSTYINNTIASFVLPAGTGQVNLLIRIDSQSSNAVVFTYDGPSILGVTPLTATTDATSIVLVVTGTSFGSGAAVYVGGVQCPAYSSGTQSSVRYDCLLQPGQGVNLPVVMKVSTQTSAQVWLFNYTAPTITTPVTPSLGVTQGGNLITLTGTSFGTSGAVTIGSITCSSSASGASWTHTKIICAVAAGQGVGYVVRVVVSDPNGQPAQSNDNTNTDAIGNVRYYSYSAPTITSLSPNPGATVGGVELIIVGTNFGTLATVTVGGRNCPTYFAQSHVQFSCLLPRGQGTGNVVNITVGPQSAVFTTYSYSAPTISSVTPLTGVTTGGFVVTITGTNLGENTATNLLFGGISVNDTALVTNITTQTQMTFTVPAGTGTAKTFVLKIAGQSVTASSTFSYAKPTITSIAGCPAGVAPYTTACPVTGGTPLIIKGTNYGTINGDVTVTVAALSCVVTNVTQTTINCTLPVNSVGGFLVAVAVVVKSQTVSASYLSYSGPTLTAKTLTNATGVGIARRLLTTSTTGNLTLSTSWGGNITFSGTFFGTDPSQVTVRYGASSPTLSGSAQFLAKTFVCLNVRNLVQDGAGVASLTCDLQSGTGYGLVFQIKVGSQYSAEGTDVVNYPRPVILSGTIRLVEADATPGTRVIGANSEGDVVYFDVNNIGGAESTSYLSVKYGAIGAVKDQVCSPVTTGYYNGQQYITCTTASGLGTSLEFEVTANGQTSAPGTDQYSYVQSPVVYSVSGCPVNALNMTSLCPTVGGTTITIGGDNFGASALAVRIGTLSCNGVTYISSTLLTCITPAGTGAPASVVVIYGQRYSRAVSYLSYAPAVVTQVSGCTDSGTSTTLCARAGSMKLTLTGTNFGPASPVAIVVIGSQYCANVVMDPTTPDSKLTCIAPTGTDTSAAVLFRQGQGSLSQTSVTVGYVQCPIGYYAASGVVQCTPCAPGSYADDVGQATCKACDSGTFMPNNGSTVCTRCAQGMYSVLTTGASIGALTCTNCSIGTYGASDGAASCSSCVGGYTAATVGLTTCTACSTGKHMATSVTFCSACDAGAYMDVSAAYKDACNTCPAGTYSSTGASACTACAVGTISSGGATQCTNCTAGHFIDVVGQASCQSCAPGRYATWTGVSACTSCQPGQYNDGDADSRFVAKPCPVGTYSVSVDSTACTQCPQGTVNPITGQSVCTSCSAGFYRDTTLAPPYVQCQSCTAGYYSSVTGVNACTACPLGKITTAKNSTVCSQCSTGTVQPTSGQSTCTVCAIGKYIASTGQGACIACDAGKYTSTNGTSSCTPCPLGTYSGSGVTVCTQCDLGYYAGSTGSIACTKCGGGYYADTKGLDQCKACPVGTYANNEGYTQCTNCTAGYIAASQGQFVCLPCSQGTVAASSGLSFCSSCASGQYQPSSNTETCLVCGLGTYGASAGQAACKVCAPGTFSNSSSLLACYSCGLGEYQPSEQSSSCLKCAAGSYQSVTAAATCLPCAAGAYTQTAGLSVCSLCDYGTYAEPIGTTGTINCTLAAPGKFVATQGARQDINCPIGTYQDQAGQSYCIACSPGYVNPSPGQVTCNACTPGSAVAASGQASCPICADGTISADYALKYCDVCDVGYFAAITIVGDFNADEYGAQNCTACSPGYVASVTGKAACDACGIGLYASAYAASNCTKCADGYYNDKEAQSTCQPCPIGQQSLGCTTAPLGGCIVCVNCIPGYFRNETGGAECSICATGSIQPLAGQGNCTLCPLGSYGDASGQTECKQCPIGQVTNQPGMSQCSLCELGKYNGDVGGSSCNNCTAGSFSDAQGSSQCTPCGVGTITALNGSSVCTSCPLGFYQPSTGQSYCLACGAGTYGDALGADECKSCLSGYYTTQGGLSECTKCPAGSYNPDIASSTCYNCSVGYASTAQGAAACIACVAGYYSNVNGSLTCSPCDPGTSQILAGASTCNNCSIGTYTSDTGSKKCTACEVGKATDQVGSATCATCNQGYYMPVEKATYCSPCPLGTSSGPAASMCSQCEPGTYASNNASTSCSTCDSGYHQASYGSSSCEACDAGYWSTGSLKPAECTQCAAGFIAMYPGTPQCAACDALATASTSRTLCNCAIGYASVIVDKGNSQEANMTCVACPDGAVCDAIGIIWTEMAADAGWWKANQTFYRCLVASYCTGGQSESDSVRCAAHRTGPLCAQIEDGYTESVDGSVKACGNQSSSTATFVVAAIAIFAAVVVQLVVLLKSGRHLIEISERDERLKVKIQSGQYVDEGDEDEHDLGLQARRFGQNITIHGPPPPRPDFTFKLKIALGFAQIISNLDVGLDIQWPTRFKSFLAALTPANIDFVQVSSIGCVVHTEFYTKLVITILMPPAVCLLLIGLYLLPGYCYYWKDRTSRKTIRRQFWKLLFYVLFLVYPYCSSTVLRTFICKRVEGVDYLQADFSLTCYTERWNYYAKIAGAMIAVYPLGIPAFFLFMLLRYHGRLDEIGVRAELGFLYDAYSRDVWWWEMLDMLHKLLITSVIAFFPYTWQLNSAMIIVCVYAGILYLAKPYVRKSDDRLHLVSLTEIIMLLMSGNVFNQAEYDPLYDWLLSIVLIILVILFFVFFVLQALHALYKVIKTWNKERKAKKAAALSAGGDGDTIDNDSAPLTPGDGIKGQQARSDWVDEYKAGVDITAPVDRSDLRRKVTGIKRSMATDGEEDVVLERNPAWNGVNPQNKGSPAPASATAVVTVASPATAARHAQMQATQVQL